jgi:hypothetical protein
MRIIPRQDNVGHTREQIIYLPQRNIITPTYSADTPQMARSCTQEPASTQPDSAAIPHPPHGLTHEGCAPDVHGDLHAVITAWPTLSEDLRTTILRLIQEGEVQQ